jgi:hypothetical protein
MIGQEFNIIFIEDKLYLTENKSLNFEQVGIAIRKFNYPACWRVRIVKLIESEKRLILDILQYVNYNMDFTYFEKDLLVKLEAITTITFKTIDTSGLLNSAYGGLKTAYKPNTEKEHSTKKEFTPTSEYNTSSNNFTRQYVVPKPQKITINESFFVPIKDVDFKSGFVSFNKKFKEYNKIIEIKIDNDDIQEEYDAVKNYFSHVLKTKKIKVLILIELSDNDIVSCKATSPEIAKITKDLIEEVKYNYISLIKKKTPPIHEERTVFTINEYLDIFADDPLRSTPFYSNDIQFMEDNLKISNSKHYRQLRFLSSKHAHNSIRLRVVHQPFSFIFVFNGENDFYFIWETLDTKEATYIWRVGKDDSLEQKVLELNRIIKIIQTDGKSSYIKSNKDDLTRIFHDYSDMNVGFIIWKEELEKLLI